jgi:uncharacterized RDD family membrane protein YckC
MSACLNHPFVSEDVRLCSRCGTAYCPNCLVEIEGRPYCATCKTQQLLDVRSGVDRTRVDYASAGRRFLALLVDGLITGIPGWIIIMVFMKDIFRSAAAASPAAQLFNPTMFALGLLGVVYHALMLAAKGQTLGKMALKIKVVRVDGGDISAGQAWGRELLRFVLGVIPCIGVVADYLPAFMTMDKTTIHDMGAKTRVVNWT